MKRQKKANLSACSGLKPAFAERNVPVALAADENYLPYLKVAINSAIASSPGSNLDIIVLHAGMPDDAIQTFTAQYAGHGNASIRFLDVSGALETSGLSDYKQTARLPLSSCYRLLLPRILPAYDKVVYIDVDVAVCRDLGELYATDVGDNWFAAAKDVVHNTKPEYLSWAEKWGFTEWDGYINAGILVMNLERFRREPVLDKLKAIVMEAAKWNCDQDALNFVCKGAIAPLDPRWNVQLGDYCIEKQIALTGDGIWIAHYTARQKPWTYPARRYSHLWWRHAAEPDVLRLWADAWGAALVQPVADAPKVSVVIPVYNSARYLPEALASVLMQKELPEIEVVCIDDGSTDDSAAILDFWEKRDSRLKIIHQKNQGPGVARNVGLDAANSEYILFLDADDRLSSGAALREALEQARTDDLDILIAAGAVMAEDGNVEKRDAYLNRSLLPATRVFGPEALGANLYIITPMGPNAKLFRRRFLAEQNLRFPALKRSEDFPFVQLALSLAHHIGVCPRSIFDRRTGVATSLESTKDETPLIFAEAEAIFRKSLSKRKLLSKFKCAAKVASVARFAYNLRSVRRFSSFRTIARHCAAEFPALKVKGDETAIESFTAAFELVQCATTVANAPDELADVFAGIQIAKVHADFRSKQKKLTTERDAAQCKAAEMRELRESGAAAIAAKDARIQELLGQMRQQRQKSEENIAAKDARIAELLESGRRIAELQAQMKRLRESGAAAVAAKDARIQELLGQMRQQRQKSKENVAAKDARIAELLENGQRIAELQGQMKRLRESGASAVAAKDARIQELLGQMRRQRQKSEETVAAKDARIAELLTHEKEHRQKIAKFMLMSKVN